MKKILFAILFSSLLLFFVFYQQIIFSTSVWILKSSVSHYLQQELDYASAHMDGMTLILEKPFFKDSDLFFADKLLIHYSPIPSQLTIAFDHPQFNTKSLIGNKWKAYLHPITWFNPSIKVTDGNLVFKDSVFHFDFDGQIERGELHCEGKSADIVSLLSTSLQNQVKGIVPDQIIWLEMHYEKKKEKPLVLGNLFLKKEKVDPIHFGCELVSDGHFFVMNIPLETFLFPLPLNGTQIHLNGKGSCEGVWNPRKISLEYGVNHLQLENDSFLLQTDAPFCFGSHQIHLDPFSHQGELYNCKVLVFDKVHELHSEQFVRAFFQEKNIHLECLEGNCEGANWEGTVNLNFCDLIPHGIKCHLSIPFFSGPISHFQKIYKQIVPLTKMIRLPIEGDFESREQGLQLNLDINLDDISLRGHVQGSIVNGVVNLFSDVSFQDVSMDFDYNTSDQIFNVSDIQGVCLIGKGEKDKEYLLGGYADIKNFSQPCGEMDLWINDNHNEELLRLAAYFDSNTEENIDIHVDSTRSHFCQMAPHDVKWKMKDWGTFENFSLRTDTSIKNVLKAFCYFLPESPIFLGELQHNLDGDCHLTLEHDSSQKEFLFNGFSSQICYGDNRWDHFKIEGKKQGNRWLIDLLETPFFTFNADIQYTERWKINCLSGESKDMLFGLKGEWDDEKKQLKGDFNILELDLTSLAVLFPFSLKGHLQGTGHFLLHWAGFPPFPSLTLQATLKDSEIASIPMEFTEPLSISVSPEKGLYPNNLKNWDLDLAKATEFDPSKTTQYYNMGSFSMVKMRELSLKSKTNFSSCLGINIEAKEMKTLFFQQIEPLVKLQLTHFQDLHFRLVDKKAHFTAFLPQEKKGSNLNIQLEQEKTKGHAQIQWADNQFGLEWEQNGKDRFVFQSVRSDQRSLFGVPFDKLNAEVDFLPQGLEISKLSIEGEQGSLSLQKLSLIKESSQQWKIDTPKLIIKNFKLGALGKEKPFKNFLIKQLELHHLTGNLGDISSWMSEGSVHFVNSSPKSNSPPLFDTGQKEEIDPQLLNPVTGTVYFQLNNGRFYFNKFKDVYSEGRGSKFYLVQPGQSWIDFQGNLFLQMRLKHTHLFFKLGQLFTLFVEGNIKNLTCFFKNNN